MFDHLFDVNLNEFNDLAWRHHCCQEEPKQEDKMMTDFENMLDGLNTRKLSDLSNDELDKVKWAVIRPSQRTCDSRVIYVVGMDKVYDDTFYEEPTWKAIAESFMATWEWQKQQAREEVTV